MRKAVALHGRLRAPERSRCNLSVKARGKINWKITSMAFAIKTEVRDLRRRRSCLLRRRRCMAASTSPKATQCLFCKRERGRARPHCAWPGHFRRSNREEAWCGPTNASREHRHQTHRPCEEATGRSELTQFTRWNDGQAETELNFKFYRQATNKIVGISDEAATFLDGFF